MRDGLRRQEGEGVSQERPYLLMARQRVSSRLLNYHRWVSKLLCHNSSVASIEGPHTRGCRAAPAECRRMPRGWHWMASGHCGAALSAARPAKAAGRGEPKLVSMA